QGAGMSLHLPAVGGEVGRRRGRCTAHLPQAQVRMPGQEALEDDRAPGKRVVAGDQGRALQVAQAPVTEYLAQHGFEPPGVVARGRGTMAEEAPGMRPQLAREGGEDLLPPLAVKLRQRRR